MKISSSYLIVILICVPLNSEGRASSGSGDCTLIDESGTELSEKVWKDGLYLERIPDTKNPSEKILRFQAKNIKSLHEFHDNEKRNVSYVTGEMLIKQSLSPVNQHNKTDEHSFYIETTASFSEYEEFETSKSIAMEASFNCTNGQERNIVINLPIQDTNNHDPKFSKSSYEYVLPMPIPKGFEFNFSGELIVRDIDLTNNMITYKVSPQDEQLDGLSFSASVQEDDPKNYVTKLTTSKLVDFENDVTFTLQATDSGTPSRSKNTTVTFKIDKGESLPRFSNQIYTADLLVLNHENVTSIPLVFLQGNISLTRVFQEIKKLELKGIPQEYIRHFELSQSKGSSNDVLLININLIKLSKSLLDEKVISIILVAANDLGEARTELHIILPEYEAHPHGLRGIIEYEMSIMLISLISFALFCFFVYMFIDVKEFVKMVGMIHKSIMRKTVKK